MRTRGEGGGGADNAELVVKKDMGNTPVKSFKKWTNFQVINMNLKFCDILVSFILIWFLHAIVEKNSDYLRPTECTFLWSSKNSLPPPNTIKLRSR